MEKFKEVRSCEFEPQVAPEGRTICGYALRFNTPSVLMRVGDVCFREVIDSGAITEETLSNNDIKAYIGHNSDRLLARSNKGTGSLHLELREDGLFFSLEAPNTENGNEALELIKRGDIRGCSFAFWDAVSRWDEQEDGTYIRHITSLPHLDDISVVVTPAYECTEVSVRDISGVYREAPTPVDDDYFNTLEAQI